MDYNAYPSLAEAYKKYFEIGSAIGPRDMVCHGPLLKRHFNAVTTENHLKFGVVRPEQDKWRFSDPDLLISFARENSIAVRVHSSLWHIQTADWMFEDDGKPVSRELLLERVEDTFKVIAGRYAGKVNYWDVVNEAISDKDGEYLRDTKWLQIIGPDYLELAFKILKKYAPDVQLFYNDYAEWVPEKREKIKKLLKSLLDAGAPVEGFGLQQHVSIYTPDLIDNLKRAIEDYAALGLRLHVTELDISLFDHSAPEPEPVPGGRRRRMALSDEMFERQAQLYIDLFAVYRSYSDVIDNVTLWGCADDITWLDNFPVVGRKNYPLLFYMDHTPKPFLKEIIEAAL